MRISKILGAFGTFTASCSAAPFSRKNSTNNFLANTTSSLTHANYLQSGDATWVWDTKLCGESTVQHSGYINVNNHTEVDKLNMAFWLFEATEQADDLPLYIILGGEYGVPVTQSVFGPTGPCSSGVSFDKGDNFKEGKHSFNHWTNTLYIETPIGLGFSYAEGDATTDLPEEEYLYTFLQRFMETFPQFDQRRILIQSFDLGARVATSFARTILEHNAAVAQGQEFGKHLKLDTMLLISPFLDPGMQMTYARKLARKNAAGKLWMAKDRSALYKKEYAIWKAECLGRDFKFEDARGKSDTAYKPMDKRKCLERFRELWHGMMEGYDTDEYRWPDIDPFDVREPRQDRMSEFLYHRTTRPVLEEWLRDSSNQRRAGFASFADGGREYSAFDRAKVDNMLVTTFFDGAPDGLKEAYNSGVKVVLVGGDMDVVTNWISLMKMAFQLHGIRDFINAPWEPMDDTKVKDDIYPIRPRYLGDANLQKRIHMKDGGNLKYIMIEDAGHDIEKQEPALWSDLAMYLTWPQPPEALVKAALDYPPRYKPNKNVPDNEAAQWPEDMLYEPHEPHGLGHFHESNFPKEETGNDTFLDPLKMDKRALTWELSREMELSRGLERRSSPSDDTIAAGPGNGDLTLDMFKDVGNTPQVPEAPPFDPAAELRDIMRGYFDPNTNTRPDPRTLMDILDEFSDSDAPLEEGYVMADESDEFIDESDFEQSQDEMPDDSWEWSEDEYDYDYETDPYQLDSQSRALDDWLHEEYTLEPGSEDMVELAEHVRQAVSQAGYELVPHDGVGSYESEYLEKLIEEDSRADPDWRKMSPEQKQKIEDWVDKTNAQQLETPETGSTPDLLQDVDLRPPGASLPNIPLQGAGNLAADAALYAARAKARKYIASGQAGAAALGAGTAAAGTGAGALGTGASLAGTGATGLGSAAAGAGAGALGTGASLAGTGAAGVGSAASLAGSTGSSAAGAASGLGGTAGGVAGGIAGGIGAGAGAGIGALFSLGEGGGGGGDGGKEDHHDEHKDDGGNKKDSSDKSKGDKKNPPKGDKKGNADAKSKAAEHKTKPGAPPAGGPADGDKKEDADAESEVATKSEAKTATDKAEVDEGESPKGDSEENTDPKSKSATETEYSAEPADPPAAGEGAGEVEGDEDGDGDNDKTDEEMRLKEKEAFDAKVEKIKAEAHKADDDAKDDYDAALERWKAAKKDVWLTEEGCNGIGRPLGILEDKSWAAELNDRDKFKDAKWSVNEVKKKLKAAAQADRQAGKLAREAREMIDKVMKGDVTESYEANYEHRLRHALEMEIRDVLLAFEEHWFKAMEEEEAAYAELKEKEKIADEKDAWDDALTKGHIPMDMAVATVEGAEREAEAKVEEKAEAEAEAKEQEKGSQ